MRKKNCIHSYKRIDHGEQQDLMKCEKCDHILHEPEDLSGPKFFSFPDAVEFIMTEEWKKALRYDSIESDHMSFKNGYLWAHGKERPFYLSIADYCSDRWYRGD